MMGLEDGKGEKRSPKMMDKDNPVLRICQGILKQHTAILKVLRLASICLCHCLRKCSRGQNLWSTDLAETWHRSWLP